MKDAATSLMTTRMVGLTVVQCVDRWLHYTFSCQLNIYSFCMKIQVKLRRCEVGETIIYPSNFTSTCSPIRVSRCRFDGKNNSPPNFTSTYFPRRVSRFEVGRRITYSAKLTATFLHHNPRRVSRCKFGGKRYGNCFLPLTLVSTEE